MLSKISSMLDVIADSLEAKGLIKEAYEIDKVADVIDKKSIIPIREKIDIKNGVTFDIHGDMVTVVKKPNGIFFCIEDNGRQTSAGFLDTLKLPQAKDMKDRELAEIYWNNLDL